MATTRKNQKWVLIKRPAADETLAAGKHFKFVEDDVAALKEGEFLVQQDYISIDPTYKLWASVDAYMPASALNEVMRGQGIGRVIESNCADFAVGDYVAGLLGLQKYATFTKESAAAAWCNKCDKGLVEGLKLENYLPVYAITGLPTAYSGLIGVGGDKIKEGNTLCVSGAAGNVGQWVVQLGKLNKMKVIGIAGGEEKCKHLTEQLKLDGAVDYKKGNVAEDLKKVAPQGIDVYFDNVGGDVSDAVISSMNLQGAVLICGFISVYNNGQRWGPDAAPVLFKRLRVQGFIVGDNPALIGECFAKTAPAVMKGEFSYRKHTVEGIENVWNAMDLLWNGKKQGKVQVKV
eukprot:TRINITY_DN3424_c0_g1_i1.p1 TRINITY_DN3424_c0_g1~~TRINITY_DN3424_c0_g1_i1.p1  ORF type:complete len:369 (+),score=90.14 TRINITY_DN3424_c0_g1_i1:67-1107(+)